MGAPKRVLKVFFDANLIYTESPSDLVSARIVDLVQRDVQDPLLEVEWYVPQIVLDERTYQMDKLAQTLLPSVNKLERVTGLRLGITAETLRDGVNTKVRDRVTELRLRPAKLDCGSVNWEEMIRASVNRLPPFDTGEREKGFRDAIALEIFMQEVLRSPLTSDKCILAFVSGDQVLNEAAQLRISTFNNTRVLGDLSAVNDLINTLSSEVSEEYVASLRDRARDMFFTPKRHPQELYLSAHVSDEILKLFASELEDLPAGASAVENRTRYIRPPVFIRKDGGTIFWQSLITIVQDLKGLPPPTLNLPTGDLMRGFNLADLVAPAKPIPMGQFLIKPTVDNSGDTRPLQDIGERRMMFNVEWSTKVAPNSKLTQPTVVAIQKAVEH